MGCKKSYALLWIACLIGVRLLVPPPLRRSHLATRPAFQFLRRSPPCLT